MQSGALDHTPPSGTLPLQVPPGRRGLADQLKWLIGLRLVVVTSVLLPAFLFQLSSSAQQQQLVRFDALLSLAGFAYVASLLYLVLLKTVPRHHQLQAYLQFAGDLLLITGLVYSFDGIKSAFSPLYLIVIAVAASLLRRRGGISVAGAAWVLYAGLVLLMQFGVLDGPYGPFEAVPINELLYPLAINLFGFFAVALLTSYLARDVARAQEELAETTEDLAQLEVFHRDVIESMTSALITANRQGEVTSINHSGRVILGVETEDVIGRSITDLGMFDELQWRNLTTAARLGARRIRDEVSIVRDQSRLWIGFSIGELRTAAGAHRGFTLIFQDLTEWRKLQEEVRMKDRMAAVGELAAGLAHEIGNPLAAISGSVQLLSGSAAENSSQRRLLEITLAESRRLDRTIKGFLQYARPKQREEVEFDVARLLHENVELLKNSEDVRPSHRVELELDSPSVRLKGDRDQVSQIFWNLTRNAIRAMPDGGTLKVVGQKLGSFYCFRVVDTGTGMSEEQRARLFHPFHSFFDEGTGIGMALVYRIVEEHGGRIEVESELGEGTSITITLPLTGVSAPQPNMETATT